MKNVRTKSIKNQLLLAFVFIALLPISFVSQIIYNSIYNTHVESVIENLSKIADKKVEQINTYSLEKLKNIHLLSKAPVIANNFQQIQDIFYHHGIDSPQYLQIDHQVRGFYQHILEIGGYYDLFLISNNGDIIFTVKHEDDFGTNLLTGTYKNSELARVFMNSKRLLTTDFSDYRYYAVSDESAAFVTAPVLKENKVIGVLALQINSQMFQKVVQDNMTLGYTGETVVAGINGKQAYFLFPLKFPSFDVKQSVINLDANVSLPILNALKGENNAGLAIDYREHEIVAAWRYIPSVQMGIVVKIDIEEALERFDNIQWLQSLFLLSIFICALLSAIYLNRLVLVPIRKLIDVTDKIAEGEISQRVVISTDDEMGCLAKSFNLMADYVENIHHTLENQVAERTQNLKEVNHLLIDQILRSEQLAKELKQTTAFQKAILNSNNFSIISSDIYGTIVSFNATAERLLGYKAEEIINKHTPSLFHDEQEIIAKANELTRELKRHIEPGFGVFVTCTDKGADENEWTYIRKNGERFPVWLSVTAIFDEEKQKVGYLGIAFDITEKKRMEAELQLAYNAIEHTSEGIIITDNQVKITLVNPAYSRIMGYEKEEVIGKNPCFSKSGRHDKNFYKKMWNSIKRKGGWEGEIWDRRKDGSVFPRWLSINAIKDYKGEIVNYVGIFMDISQQKATEEKLEQLAFYDPLTGLANRALFRDRLTQELVLAKRNRHQTAIFFIDLDRFKWVNDNLGHDIGDDLLIAVSDRITQQVRVSDSVCRLGGDEFTVILCELSETSKLENIAEKIITALQQAFHLKGYEVFIGASIGIAIFPDDGEDFSSLIKSADVAMYKAKNAGRGTYRFFKATQN